MPDAGAPKGKPNESTLKLFAYGEEEWRRVARELHDDVGQRLAMLAGALDGLKDEIAIPDAVRRQLRLLAQQAQVLCSDVRDISHSLHPAVLEDLGLEVALRALVRHFGQRTGLVAEFTATSIQLNIPADLSTAIYRIAQEALRNIEKHAGDTPVSVTLERQPTEIVMVISDEGNGFDLTSASGLGLTSMQERTNLFNGIFRLTSRVGQGTTIEVRAPFIGVGETSY